MSSRPVICLSYAVPDSSGPLPTAASTALIPPPSIVETSIPQFQYEHIRKSRLAESQRRALHPKSVGDDPEDPLVARDENGQGGANGVGNGGLGGNGLGTDSLFQDDPDLSEDPALQSNGVTGGLTNEVGKLPADELCPTVIGIIRVDDAVILLQYSAAHVWLLRLVLCMRVCDT